ncbi:MAG: MBL fold metallo-hydrolase [Desulfonauticus sp.]|nr:MBL fold metallo-hydrolase [Desulfonauticus sp.]
MMEVIIWGCRGGIPVSGKEYVIFGGNTPCVQVKTPKTCFIIDAGTGIRKLGELLIQPENFSPEINFLFTHVHWDHILGLPFFKPLYKNIFQKINLFFCPKHQPKLFDQILHLFKKPYFPVERKDIQSKISIHHLTPSFHYHDLEITSIPLSHPDPGLGFKFTHQQKVFVYLTDNELNLQHPTGKSYTDYKNFSFQADLLIHDAEYTQHEYNLTKGWGHSYFESVIQLAIEAKVKKLGIFHHSQHRTDKELLKIEKWIKKELKPFQIDAFVAREHQTIIL